MTRDQAINKLEKPAHDPRTINQEIEYIANKLNISTHQLKSYMDLPKKNYKDYKSHVYIYNEAVAFILKSFGIEKRWQALISVLDYGCGNTHAFINAF